MSVIDEYLATLKVPEQAILNHLYQVVRDTVPDAEEIVSYNMPAFALGGKAFLSIVANKNFMSLYPFTNLERLGLDLSAYECTKGSIHFTLDNPISDDLLRAIIQARLQAAGYM